MSETLEQEIARLLKRGFHVTDVEAADVLRERQPDLGWPFSLEDASIEVHPLAADPASSLVVGISLDALESWIEVFAIAGGSLRHLIPAQVCRQLAISPQLEASAGDHLVALLQPEGAACQLPVDGRCPHSPRWRRLPPALWPTPGQTG
jgi:hypothetical protein